MLVDVVCKKNEKSVLVIRSTKSRLYLFSGHVNDDKTFVAIVLFFVKLYPLNLTYIIN